MKTLEQQIEKSITSTMQGHKPTDSQLQALTAYVKSLKPASQPDTITDQTEAVSRGHELFVRNNCARCHTPPLFTSAATYDVGLHDEMGARLFNPPSLRGVSQAAPTSTTAERNHSQRFSKSIGINSNPSSLHRKCLN